MNKFCKIYPVIQKRRRKPTDYTVVFQKHKYTKKVCAGNNASSKLRGKTLCQHTVQYQCKMLSHKRVSPTAQLGTKLAQPWL